MSFSGGGKTSSKTTNEQNPITATDSAVVANEGSRITVTDGGAFELVSNVTRDVIDSNSNTTDQAIGAGLNYFDKAINAIGQTSSKAFAQVADTTTQLFDSQKSDELNENEQFHNTVSKIATVGGLVAAVYFISKVYK